MMHRWVVVSAALAALLHAMPAEADGQRWSAVGPRTVEPGGDAVDVSVGWPSLAVSYAKGVAPGLNIGARASWAYGVEGQLRDPMQGVKLQALTKVRLFDGERVSFGFTFEPGVLAHFPGGGGLTRVGFALPVGLRLGVAASSALALGVLVEVPMWLELVTGGPAVFNLLLLTGVGAEYFLTSDVSLYARAVLGPTLLPASGAAVLTLDARVAASFHF